MTSITYIGMDVHTTNFTLCCYSFEDDKVYATVQVKPEYTQILKYMNASPFLKCTVCIDSETDECQVVSACVVDFVRCVLFVPAEQC